VLSHASDGAGAEMSPTPKRIAPRDRLIVALDVPGYDEAIAMVDRLGESVTFYKVGLEVLMSGDYLRVVDALQSAGKKIMVDLKLFDVPETVARAVRRIASVEATFATVHGNDEMLRAAVAEKDGVGILAVTVLTSLDRGDLRDLGFDVDPGALVLSRARRAIELGCDGVVSSGLEAPALRREHGDGFLVVTPGIRPVDNVAIDDQKRTVDVEEAFLNGADYIVVGRPISKASDPRAKAEAVQQRIDKLFAQ
jgi:orotidine-5'-phosphate decarboxylase